MNNLRKATILHASLRQNVNLTITRNLRGQMKRRVIGTVEPSSSPIKDVAKSVDTSDDPFSNPKPGQQLGYKAMFGLSEEKLQELSESIRAKNRDAAAAVRKTPVQQEEEVEPEPEAVTLENQHEKLAECVTPLYKMGYGTQLQLKQSMAENVLRVLKKRLYEVCTDQLPAQNSGMPCPLQTIIPSPVQEKYRNKDEFVVYRGVDGNPKTVGFLTGHPKFDTTVCVPPTHLIIIKDIHKQVCSHFEHYIRSSRHNSCLHFRDSCGVWRSLIVRSTNLGDLMAVVIIHPHTLTKEEVTELEDDLRQYFVSGPGAEVGLTSLYMQICEHTRCTREQAPFKLLHGEKFITETCGHLTLRISPDTFYQINAAAAELLYDNVKEVAELSELTTLLDVCSGTGSIGLLLAKEVRGVVGMEAVTSAVEDANSNAKFNGITNATFIPGAAEKVLPYLKSELVGCSDLVAVVNPGRGGIHPKVIEALRATPGISKLLYLSCRPEGYATDNFVSLGNMLKRNKTSRFPPLLPRFAFTVDMFPHTKHYEMGILFVREHLI